MRLITKSLGVLKCQLNFLTDRTFNLPLVTINLTTRCNSRCLTCNFWRTQNKTDFTLSGIKNIADSAKRLNIKTFNLSGGEPLLHPDFTAAVEILSGTKARLQLITNGVLLERYAFFVSRFFSKVFISLDESTPELYREVRGVDALKEVARGVMMLKKLNPSIIVIARTIIQKSNYSDLISIIKTAKDIMADHISFQAADMYSFNFGRNEAPVQEDIRRILLDENDLSCFRKIIDNLKRNYPFYFSSRFIIDKFNNLSDICNYYKAMTGKTKFLSVRCNLPWVSAVVDADGRIQPCCFLRRDIGNIDLEFFEKIVKSFKMIKARRDIKRARNSICGRCVFSRTKVKLSMLYRNF